MGIRKLRSSEKKRPEITENLYKTFIVLSDEKPVEKETISTEPVAEETDPILHEKIFVEVPIGSCEAGTEDVFEAYRKAAAKYGRIRQSLFSIVMAAVFFLAFFILLIAVLVSPKGIIFSGDCKPVNFTDEMAAVCQQYWNGSQHVELSKDNYREGEYMHSCIAVLVAMETKGSCSVEERIRMVVEAEKTLISYMNMTLLTCHD